MDDQITTSRRGLLKCMLWAGAGALWAVNAGVPRLVGFGNEAEAATADFTFMQISDTHIGFHGDANPDPGSTMRLALDRIAGMQTKPALLLHTGDVSHLSKAEEFDAAQQIMKQTSLPTYFVPGEHDVIGDDGKGFFARFGQKGASGKEGGWYSFDQGGVHFIGLVNVLNLRAGGLGSLGEDQLEWLEADLKPLAASTPIVVFAHMPLWSVYPQWGWGTDDGATAVGYLKRFGSVTVLNGHIHQVIQKTEGNVSFQTAMSTAFPQPAPGTAPAPGPMKVAAEKLRSTLGVRRVDVQSASHKTAVVDSVLEG